MPTSANQIFELQLCVLRQLRPEILISKLDNHLLERQLPVLPIFGHDLIENNTEGVDVGRLLWFENDTVFVFEVFDSCVHGLVGVAGDEGQVLPHGVQAAAVEYYFIFFLEDVDRRDAAVYDVVLVQLKDRLSQPHAQLYQLGFTHSLVH